MASFPGTQRFMGIGADDEDGGAMQVEQGMIVAHADHESIGVVVRATDPLFVRYKGEDSARIVRSIDLRPVEDVEIGTDLL